MLELFTQVSFAGVTLAGFGQILLRRFPAKLKATAAPAPHIEPVLTPPRMPEEAQKADAPAADRDDWTTEIPARFALRPVHLRKSGIADEKIMERFIAWMISQGYSGWHTSSGAYDVFKDFAWEERYEELSRGTFLSLLTVELGVEKRRAYIDKNDTFRHLRAAARSQGRATIYRIPTAEELAAAKHKRALKDAEARHRMRMPKARLDGGVRPHPQRTRANEIEPQNKGLGVDAPVFDVAA
ncbi:hypothetical protein [Hyphomicrobium sp. MC8b]|uniref:hypothetical protein n=1 Tax=Hyphomicrobium sp. MC8b TaxID=300273 RepID=UPI0039199EC6